MKINSVKVVGALLSMLAAIFFVIYVAKTVDLDQIGLFATASVISATAALVLLYALTLFGSAFAWHRMLLDMHQPSLVRNVYPLLAATQFGKYLPGNVAQHIGRIAFSERFGIKFEASLLSVSYELVLSMVASVHVGTLMLLWDPPAEIDDWLAIQYKVPLIVLVSLSAIGALYFAPKIAAFIARRRNSQAPGTPTAAFFVRISTLVASYLIYASSFVIIGAGLWFVARSMHLDDIMVPNALFFIGAFASSWILGYVAPGAPAGLGVRELVMTAWLGMYLPPAATIALVVLLRIATTAGDLLNFAWASLWLWKRNCVSKA